MQKINLLPRDLAPPGLNEKSILYIRRAAVVLGGLILVLALLGLGLRLEFARRSKILSKIKTKVKESDLLEENIGDLRKRVNILRGELADIQVYLSQGLVWSEKLIQISSLMPDEVWLKKISFRRGGARFTQQEVLNLTCALVPLDDTPINVLSAFVNKMKADKDFFADFGDLLISDIKTGQKDNMEIMEFEIQLVLRK